MPRIIVLGACLFGLLMIVGNVGAQRANWLDRAESKKPSYLCQIVIDEGCCEWGKRSDSLSMVVKCTTAIYDAVKKNLPPSAFPKVCCDLEFFKEACRKAGLTKRSGSRNYGWLSGDDF